jgi:anti-sigma factor RsiW
MTHPTDDALLLFAYGELPEPDTAALTRHLGECAACRARLARLDRSRVAVDWAVGRRGGTLRRRVWTVALGALAAAAVLAAVLLRARPETASLSLTLPRYTAPGLAPVDSLLTRLEQEKLYAMP